MIHLHLITGMRSGEVCRINWGEIDTSKPVWTYHPPGERPMPGAPPIPTWTVYQLRHTAGTKMRKEMGRDYAKAALGTVFKSRRNHEKHEKRHEKAEKEKI